jgi:hypothetical protein
MTEMSLMQRLKEFGTSGATSGEIRSEINRLMAALYAVLDTWEADDDTPAPQRGYAMAKIAADALGETDVVKPPRNRPLKD